MGAPTGQKLSHYVLLEEIGRGGMGVVRKAKDTVLGRTVAIKVLPADLGADEHRRQLFLEEARRAASVSHANIAQVHELGHEGNLSFIVLEYVEGQSLSKILHGKPLPVDKVTRWGLQIGRGLAWAHRKGLLHRDLKPANVLITTEGNVKIVDFGLAILFSPVDSTVDSKTSTMSESESIQNSSIAGTLPYMSPEQVQGTKLDARSDIFSLGTVLYEMTTGHRPFSGPRPVDVANAILECRPVPVHEVVSNVPLELDRIIHKALAQHRSNRYQTMDDLAVDLEHLGKDLLSGSAPSYDEILPRRRGPSRVPKIVLVVALALGTCIVGLRLWKVVQDRNSRRTAGTPHETSDLGTLPVGDPDQSAEAHYERGLYYLEDWETLRALDDAIGMFNRAVEMKPDFAVAWAMLGEAYWVRYHHWTHDESSRREAEKAIERAYELVPDLPEAHNAKGYGHVALSRYEPALLEFETALRSQPEFDRAWANLGYAHQLLQNYSPALDAFREAVRLRPDHWRYHLRLGYFFDRFSEQDAATGAYEKAIELKPDSKMAWNNLGTSYLKTGRPEKAITPFTRSLDLEETGVAYSNLGTAYYFLSMYDKAAENYVQATLIDPTTAAHWANLGDAFRELEKKDARGLYLAAVRLARERVVIKPRDPYARIALALFCAKAGDLECAISEAQSSAAMRPQDPEIGLHVAITYRLLGRQEESLDWLEKAVKLGISRSEIENDPDLRTLEENPRYRRIIELAS